MLPDDCINYISTTHRMNSEKCGAHFIRAVVLEELVWAHIKMVISCITCHESYFRSIMEQRLMKSEAEALQREIEQQAQNEVDLESFISKVREYSDLRELTPYALQELVKAVYIEAPVEIDGKRRQNIRIQYDFVGFIPLNELNRQ